jgi:pimeloyl-ACP methyl ester carboxylesterase
LAGCQSWFIFEPDRTKVASPSDFPFRIVEVTVPVRNETGRLQHLHGWWIPSQRSQAKTVLYFHGNDDNVSRCVTEVAPVRELGHSIFLVDYRGFGESDGRVPSETTVYEDAEAAWRYLVEDRGVAPRELFIYGHSLGGAIAVELARRHPEAAGLIVESSFTSIFDMAQLDKRFRMLPVKRFLNQRFESAQKVGGLRLPVLFLHGTEDEIVPFWMGQQLYTGAPQPKRFVPIEGGRHDHDASGEPVIREALRRFIGEPLQEAAK